MTATESSPLAVVTAFRSASRPWRRALQRTAASCSIREPDAVLRELFRVIRPGGELRFYEHVRAATPRLSRVQAVADALFWPRVAGGFHSARDTRSAMEQASFVVERCREFAFHPAPLPFFVAPHILGIARRP